MASGAARRQALHYAEDGWAVLPIWPSTDGACECGKKDCKSPGKHPIARLVPSGVKDASRDSTTIKRWWTQYPRTNIGVATGRASGIVVLDIDPRNGGDHAVAALEREHGALPKTAQATTGGGGRHIFFLSPETPFKNSAGKLGSGLDIKSDGGYIVAPPSRHASGETYEWCEPVDAEILPLPVWLEQLITAPEESRKNGRGAHRNGKTHEGERNDRLASYAGMLRRKGYGADELADALLQYNEKNCSPPLGEQEVLSVARSISRYEPDLLAARTVDDDALALTDLGNAKRLVARHGHDIRYCGLMKKWFVWDGVRWRSDDTGNVERRAKDTVTFGIEEESRAFKDQRAQVALLRFGKASQSAARIRSMLLLAQSEEVVAVSPDDFDRNPWLLNCTNGTIDLETGALLPHSREDLITKVAPTAYKPNVTSKLFNRFLERVLPNADIREFVQRAAGYSLVGTTSEERLFLLCGPGATGKSTFIGAIAATLGDYVMTADFETWTRRDYSSGGPRNDIARLAGSRIVVSQEVDKGRRWAEALIKTVTGGDTVAARYLYQESREFKPTFTLWFGANDRPGVSADDDAMWRRIVEIPFDVQIPKTERDPRLKDKLTNPKQCGRGILGWLVEGCLSWQEEGLDIPDAVLEATEAYRRENDTFADFLDDCLVSKAGDAVPVRAVWDAYQEWAIDHDHAVLSQVEFSKRMQARFEKGKQNNGTVRVWRGVALS